MTATTPRDTTSHDTAPRDTAPRDTARPDGARLHLFDTMSNTAAPVSPGRDGPISLYACGPTVYDRPHIGNARARVSTDLLVRVLEHVHGAGAVRYVSNITDIDDKIIARARAMAQPGDTIDSAIDRLVGTTIRDYRTDMAALGCRTPDMEPRARDHVADMISMIETLVARGAAYVSDDTRGRHVLFSVDSFRDYGRLANRQTCETPRTDSRVETAAKASSADFVLWKPSLDDEPGWNSPWGRGRPGWHIECSAMINACLGTEIDIHAGGVDLCFPHHENEIAQSRMAFGTDRLARIWMHTGSLTVDGAKMAKSLGNTVTVNDLLNDGLPGSAIRLALLMRQHRAPLDWTRSRVEEARDTLSRWTAIIDGREDPSQDHVPEDVAAALLDDLNTPKAIAALHGRAREGDANGLAGGMALMGLVDETEHFEKRFKDSPTAGINLAVSRILDLRAAARARRNFAEADRLRDRLNACGIEIRDTIEGTRWTAVRMPDKDAIRMLAGHQDDQENSSQGGDDP